MRIDSSGNVGIGATSSLDKLTVAGGIKSTSALNTSAVTANSTFVDNNTGARMLSYGPNTTTNGTFTFYQGKSDNSSGQTAMSIDASGNLTAAGNVTAYSDARLKKNVSTIDNALALVEKMRGVRYDRIDSGKAGIGVIAQEMQEVVPEVVHEGEEHLSVAYGNLVGVLIEAVKELSARVKELEAK
jgi:hypothetical protein